MRSWLAPIERALDAVDEPVDVFFRDDDVGWGDDRLWPLLELFADRGLPVDLAVIPYELTSRLAGALRHLAAGGIGLHQHGFAHVNHEPDGRKYEFGAARSASAQLHDINAGRSRLRSALGDVVDSIFTPPWNRCTETTADCLATLGFRALSRQSRAEPFDVPGLVELPIHVDWFAHHKRVRLAPPEFGELVARTVGAGGPVGFMFHHAVMDADERAATGELLTLLAEHPNVAPHLMRTLVQRSGRPGNATGSAP